MMVVLEHAHERPPAEGFRSTGDRFADLASVAPGGCPHDRAAWATALDDGLLRAEVREILAGRRIVDAFPVRRGEKPQAYAARAVAEMMVAYLG